ncbi:MAG: PatB family C-S lyase [Bacteroidales bacterium]|nr:PatB family C-S lyase [Bacteroidales bacterium]
MRRRDFIKGTAAVGASTLVPAGTIGALLASCAKASNREKWNFDEVRDRSGTWSIKYGRATDGEIPMWIADMDFKTDPFVAEALRMRLDRDVLGYTSTPQEFIDAIAAWERNYHGFNLDNEWVSYAPGVITSINQAYITFTEPGDKVIIQPPVYDHFRLYIERMGRVAVDNPLIFENGRYRMDFEGLEQLFDDKTKILLLCNPQNPCGILWDKETLATLAEICDRHGVIVVSDEIHGDLALYGKKHTPFCSVSETARRIGVMFAGPTKAFNLAGLSGTAYSIIPEKEKRDKYNGTLRNSKLDEPSIMTLVAQIAAYREDTTWLESLKKYIENNIAIVERFFSDHDLGIVPIRPQASFLVWLDCRALGLNQTELMDLFRKKAKIIPSNGLSYGAGGEGFVRLNIGCPASVLNEALDRLLNAF